MDGSMDLQTLIKLQKQYAAQLPGIARPLRLPHKGEIAGWIDHTLLKPDATAAQVEILCQQALEYQFASVCVNPAFVPLVASILEHANSSVKTCAVIGFPLGATLPGVKASETAAVIEAGASEVDMVMNIGALKGKAYGQVLLDIQAVVVAAHPQDAMVKVIIETALLNRDEKIMACLLCKEAGADFVKTSTGFSTGGATTEDIVLMRRVVGEQMGVKASGGIRTYADAIAMIKAGANRIGASSGIQIVKEALA
jgi:deoxyribose-phosphate aldolase